MKVYIAGPITGVPDYREKFAAARARLEAEGHKVMDPSVLPEGFAWEDYMPACVAMISVCDAVYLMRGWKKSRGAKLENNIARAFGKVILVE